jgi:hypothetical protein
VGRHDRYQNVRRRRTIDGNIGAMGDTPSVAGMAGPILDVDQINAAGPKSSLFVGAGLEFLVAREAGVGRVKRRSTASCALASVPTR